MAEVRTGRLTERIKIYEEVETVNEYGTTFNELVLYWETWGNVRPIRGRASLEANQVVMKDAYKITVRYRPDKNPNKKLVMIYRGKHLRLNSIINDEAGKAYVEFWGNYEDAE